MTVGEEVRVVEVTVTVTGLWVTSIGCSTVTVDAESEGARYAVVAAGDSTDIEATRPLVIVVSELHLDSEKGAKNCLSLPRPQMYQLKQKTTKRLMSVAVPKNRYGKGRFVSNIMMTSLAIATYLSSTFGYDLCKGLQTKKKKKRKHESNTQEGRGLEIYHHYSLHLPTREICGLTRTWRGAAVAIQSSVAIEGIPPAHSPANP